MITKARLTQALAAAVLAAFAANAPAQTVKVGVKLTYTGIGAEFAQQVDRGMQQFMKLNPGAFGSCKVELVKRDGKNPGGADSKTAVQELITQDKVDILAGIIYSGNAIATAPLVDAAQKPMIIMNAGTAWITNLSPYIARVSFSMWHAGYAMGDAAAKVLKAKTAVVGYSDFPPGKDSLDAFKTAFEAAGGKVIDEIPMGGPAQVPDFTPFFQRAKDKKPDVFFVFVPAGDHAVGVVKTYAALGMRQAGIKLIGPGDITQDFKLQAMGKDAVGLITMHHYHADLDNAANKRLVASWKKDYGARHDAGLHGHPGLRRHGRDRARRAHAQLQDRSRPGDGGAQGLEVRRQPARSDPDRPGDARHRHERVPERADDEGRPPVSEERSATIENVKDMCKELKVGRCGK